MILVSKTETLKGIVLSILDGVVLDLTTSTKIFSFPLAFLLFLDNEVHVVTRSNLKKPSILYRKQVYTYILPNNLR